ncbi:hypothetical protein [Steroidobacter agaridevorans]|uniref:hypothetical protein n=1 Tax=Steroidobacter agaridevorans TaxID=2695856 RepID=UPI00132A1B8A|nr:hypothetical protein [Steroidobacter agaridevorans]GFE91876.1 hypothetical protein GCM10011488_68300 [Steroidobacter agaridevorans]
MSHTLNVEGPKHSIAAIAIAIGTAVFGPVGHARNISAQAPKHGAASPISTLVRASEVGAHLDSDLMKGGGTDDTSILQGILDRAKGGEGVHLIIDGPALVTGLDIYSNSTIECTGGGGLYLKDGSNRAIVRNGHRSRFEVTDQRVGIRNCFLNGNSDGQLVVGPPLSMYRVAQEADGTFMSGLQFSGVHYLVVENVHLWNIRSFGMGVANAKFIQIRDVTVDIGAPPFPTSGGLAAAQAWMKKYAGNRDGLNFAGPIQYVTINGVLLRSWDDALSFHADVAATATRENVLGPFLGGGPITDVTVNNVVFEGASHGIRLQSASERMDRIIISNVSGTVRERMAVISSMGLRGGGNFGSIIMSNVNVDLLDSYSREDLYAPLMDALPAEALAETQAWWKFESLDIGEESDLPLFSLNGDIENLQLRQVATKGIAKRPLIRIGNHAAIGALTVDLSIHSTDQTAVPMKILGKIERANIFLDWGGKSPIEYHGGGAIAQLRWDGPEYK